MLRSTMQIGQPVASITSRQFNHDVGSAKRAALVEPVIITDRGEPAFVLLTYEQFERMRGRPRSLLEVLRDPDGGHIDFEPPRLDFAPQIPDFDE